MKPNDNPIFTMIPVAVLVKAKALALEFQAEEDRKEFIWRHVLLVTAVVVGLLALNILNALIFGAISHGLFKDNRSVANAFGIFAFAVAFGGTAFSIYAFVAWLEAVAPLDINSPKPSEIETPRLYRYSTWIPLAAFVGLPIAFNALFDLTFFLILVGFGFVVLLLGMVASDV